MKIKIIIVYITGMAVGILQTSCRKYLDAKPSSAYSTVSSINDAQLLLDNALLYMDANVPVLGEYASDNMYVTDNNYNATGGDTYTWGNVYTWGKYPFLGVINGVNDNWGMVYSSVMVANTVLDALDKIKPDNSNLASYNNVRGTALAYRGYYFWKLATTYAKSYREESANSDLGIPLRLNININEVSTRGTVQTTYDQIIKDLTAAAALLPEKPSVFTRPSKSSVYAMLAEVYLSMRKYDQAQTYANQSLSIKNELINYNTLDVSSPAPIPMGKDNPEILMNFSPFLFNYYVAADPVLYNLYSNNDLRKKFFYTSNIDGTYNFSVPYSTFGYTNNGILFTGPTTAEMYLTRAECTARKGDVNSAMQDLNILLKNRVTSFVPLTASSQTEALNLILNERRKELVMRDLRWMDLKRLNVEGANISITRNLNGKVYTLAPNDNRYAIQLPPDVIQISGMQQNPY